MTDPRTTDELVAGVIEVDASIPLAPFKLAANLLVTEMCTGTNGPSTPYDEERLQTIETWLAAHFYGIRDNRTASESAGPVSASFQFKVDLGFDATMQGQMAMRLDTNGGLAIINDQMKKGKRKPKLFWLGTTKCGEV